MDYKWRFPAANFGTQKGISTGDIEAFKKAPYQAFAREILQNSVDAHENDGEPVKVEFSIFELETTKIPGLDDLKAAIRRCKEFWSAKQEYVDECKRLEKELLKEKITCLRVSDYNTTGLRGVESNDTTNNQFLALTRGSGVSEKSGKTAGGSKGMGKNAAFLMSKINTVFYSTKTTQNIKKEPESCIGSIGVANFISGYHKDDYESENRDYTQGEGFFSKDEFNSALDEVYNFDSNQKDRNIHPGTDIYILSFRDNDKWDKEIINSILDSFMVTIYRHKLEVSINDIEINKDTLEDLVYSDLIENKNKSNIISQYRLLSDGDHVKAYDIDFDDEGLGHCELYILPYSKEEEHLATHKCCMVRHPLMKIRDYPLSASFRVSALCIIPDNKLGQMLRKIENPQHIDWEPKRITDNPSERKEYELIIREIKDKINERVMECLSLGENVTLDPSGAGDFLPEENDLGDSKGSKESHKKTDDDTTITKIKENKPKNQGSSTTAPNNVGLEPDIGDVIESDDEDDAVKPIPGEGPRVNPKPHDDEETGEKVPGDNVILVRSRLSGVNYKCISLNKTEGLMKIVFISPANLNECYLCLSSIDDANKSNPVDILSLSKNGVKISCSNSNEFGPFDIKLNEKVVLNVETSVKGYFAASVKVVCIERKKVDANKE